MLLIDGVKYELWIPPSEDEFEKILEKHAEDIFGKDAKYFDLKHKLASKSGTGSIPDGYVITLGDKPKVQIIEFELESHSLQHIVSQMVNIINGIENSATQQKICNAIEDGINEDQIFAAKIMNTIRPVAVHRFLSDSFSNTLPIVNIIIDQSWSALEEAVSKISPTPKIIEFKTFIRENVGLPVHAHLFEPLYISPKVIPVLEQGETIASKDTLELTIDERNISFHYFSLYSGEKSFFPVPRTRFSLITDIGEIQTNVAGNEDTNYWIQRNLAEWYRQHSNLKVGDVVIFKVVEPMKKYRLEIL